MTKKSDDSKPKKSSKKKPTKRRQPKIEFASSVAIEGLQPFVDELLDCLAETLHMPGARSAFVSDLSSISDFLEGEDTGRTSPHPLDKRKRIKVVTTNTAGNRKLVRAVAKALGVPVGIRDRVYEVAIRLRDKQ